MTQKPQAHHRASPLLIHEPPLQVLPSLAVAVGLNEAIVLQQIHYWLQRSQNEINGHLWVYNSVAEWKKQFPFWATNTIVRTLTSLRASGVVVAEHLSDNPRDRSLYYRIDYNVLADLTSEGGSTEVGKCNYPEWVNGHTQNGLMDAPKMGKSLYKTETTAQTTTETTADTFTPVAVAPVAGPVFPPIDDAVVKQAKPAPVGTVAVAEAAEVVEHTPTAKPKATKPTAKPKATKPAGDKTAVAAVACPSDVDAAVFADFLAIRKVKRAPLTATALGGIRREADKAGVTLEEALTVCCERGWVGFRADWHHEGAVTNVRAGGTLNKQEALEARNRAVAAQWVADMQAKMSAQGGVL